MIELLKSLFVGATIVGVPVGLVIAYFALIPVIVAYPIIMAIPVIMLIGLIGWTVRNA